MPPPAIDIKALRKNYDVQGGGAYEVSSIASTSCDVLNNTSSSNNLSLDSRSDRQGGFRRSPFGTFRKSASVEDTTGDQPITDTDDSSGRAFMSSRPSLLADHPTLRGLWPRQRSRRGLRTTHCPWRARSGSAPL